MRTLGVVGWLVMVSEIKFPETVVVTAEIENRS
jgi:hypothetical protein